MFLSSKSNLFLFYPKNLSKSITTNPSLRIRIVIDRYATVNQFPTIYLSVYHQIPFTRNLGGLILLRFKCRSLLNGWLRQYVRLIDFEEETNKARPPLSLPSEQKGKLFKGVRSLFLRAAVIRGAT